MSLEVSCSLTLSAVSGLDMLLFFQWEIWVDVLNCLTELESGASWRAAERVYACSSDAALRILLLLASSSGLRTSPRALAKNQASKGEQQDKKRS